MATVIISVLILGSSHDGAPGNDGEGAGGAALMFGGGGMEKGAGVWLMVVALEVGTDGAAAPGTAPRIVGIVSPEASTVPIGPGI